MDQFDYVIIGGGTAGSVIAGRLAEDPGTSVCVLEAGPPDRNIFIHIPAGFMKTFVNPALNWMYETEPSPTTGDRIIAAPRGKTLGGSSSINGMIPCARFFIYRNQIPQFGIFLLKLRLFKFIFYFTGAYKLFFYIFFISI